MATSMWVRTPASLPCCSRSMPSKPPSTAANSSRTNIRVACSTSEISENSEATVSVIFCQREAAMGCSKVKWNSVAVAANTPLSDGIGQCRGTGD